MNERTANIRLLNETGGAIESAGVIHKYSDVYKDTLTFGNSIADQATGDGNVSVRYRTGAGEIGLDWWLVYWFTPAAANGGVVLHMSSPNNLRGFADFLDIAIPDMLGLVSAGTAITALVSPEAITKTISAVIILTSAMLTYVAKKTMNKEPTCGFKEHMLTSEDAGKDTVIRLTANDKIIFESPSGKSATTSKKNDETAAAFTVGLDSKGGIMVTPQ